MFQKGMRVVVGKVSHQGICEKVCPGIWIGIQIKKAKHRFIQEFMQGKYRKKRLRIGIWFLG